MKYIINEDREVKIFSDSIRHSDMAVSKEKIVGAGFMMIVGGRVSCFGESISLGIKSRPEQDGRIINLQLRLEEIHGENKNKD